MPNFNTLLDEAGLDPRTTRVVRHKARRLNDQLYDAALQRRPAFETYQATQNRPVFGDAMHLAAFVVDRSKCTLFVGIWQVGDHHPGGEPDPFTGERLKPSGLTYSLIRTSHLEALFGRVVIEWGPGYRAWVQRADLHDKGVIEIRHLIREQAQPGHPRY